MTPYEETKKAVLKLLAYEKALQKQLAEIQRIKMRIALVLCDKEIEE